MNRENHKRLLRGAFFAASLAGLSLIDVAAGAAEKPRAAAIASAHPLATEAGHEVLAAGGNAFDAAVAVSAALAVVEPAGSGLGGGGFWLLHRARDGFEVMIDGRERTPLKADRDMYLDSDGKVVDGLSIDGPLAAGIPGEPAALAHIADNYGDLPLAKSLAPAIRFAREGFLVDSHYRQLAVFRLQALRASPAAAEIFLVDGEAPTVGYRLRQRDLAETLERIARDGRDGFYAGSLAQKLVDGAVAEGGIWILADLADYKVVEREPIRGEYHGLRITSAAPPSSGGIVLITALNVLSGFTLDNGDRVRRAHLITEAMRRAYRDRALYLGDPDFVDIPVDKLTHPLYADGLRAGIRMDRATASDTLPGVQPEEGGSSTTHFSVLDKEGNRVAATLSINYPFGSAFVAPGTGVLLNDEMDDFAASPGVPNVYGLVGAEANAIEPGKRMLSSMTPTFLENDQRVAVLGTPGGSRIISMVLLASLEFADNGSAQSMVELPRFHHQYLPDVVQYEREAFDLDTTEKLNALGHITRHRQRPYGNMHVVIWDKKARTVEAASDPRGVGEAVVR
ncbi:MAG: gamma-glutamyltransferase [Gammaproteobacteria bacterium]